MENSQRSTAGEQKSTGQGSPGASIPPLIINVDGKTMRAMFASWSTPVAAQLSAPEQPLGVESPPLLTGFASGASRSGYSVAIKRRGRPRRIDAPPGFPIRGHSRALRLLSPPAPPNVNPSPPTPATIPGRSSSSAPPAIKPRQKRQATAATRKQTQTGAQGTEFSALEANVVYVKPGEDLSSKIMEFCLSNIDSTSSVCVMSAVGAISHATVQRTPTSDGFETFEGWLEIMSLVGCYDWPRVAGERTRTGALTVTLAKGDGRVVAGCVGGPLIAASRVQIVLGSFGAKDENANAAGTSGANASAQRIPAHYMEPSAAAETFGASGSAPNKDTGFGPPGI